MNELLNSLLENPEKLKEMIKENKKYCSFPDESNINKIKEFMDALNGYLSVLIIRI